MVDLVHKRGLGSRVALAPLDEARAAILAAVAPLPRSTSRWPMPWASCSPRRSSRTSRCRRSPNTAMDGYAVRAADTEGASADAPVRLRVVDELPAGRAPRTPVGAGEAIRIMTGAPMPDGADAS